MTEERGKMDEAVRAAITSMGYDPLAVIGEGSCKTVIEARDVKNNVNVAIKYVPLTGDEKRLQQKKDALQMEIAIIKSLNHVNIARLLDHRVMDNAIYVVMEVLESDLKRHLAHGLLKTADAPMIFLQVARGLNYLHSNNICHRNIRYKNVLVRSDLLVKLRDFGLAKVVSQDVETGVLHGGHLGYMPPEQYRRDAKKDPMKGDMWSLGVLLFMLVFQKYPFSLDHKPFSSEKLMMDAIDGKELVFPKDSTDADAKDLASLMLKYNPSERISSASVLEHRWLAGADDKLKKHMEAHRRESYS